MIASAGPLAVAFEDQGSLGLTDVAGGSVAWGDYDNDGWLDVLLTGMVTPDSYIAKVYHNDGNNTFHDVGAGLTGVGAGSVAWGDYDNDGWLDVLLTGMVAPDSYIAKVYHNDGNNTFRDVGAGLTGVMEGSVAWGDYDNDGRLDILLTGNGSGKAVAKLYHNDGGGSFHDVGAGLTGVTSSSAAWGDYDNDGRLDILLAGYDGLGKPIAKVYRNDGNGSFHDIGAGLAGAGYGCVAWADYDSDGRLDALVSGVHLDAGYTRIAKVYHNDGNNTFQDIGAGLTDVDASSVAWGDYDKDGRLDVLLTGRDASDNYIAKVYKNVSPTANSVPDAPTFLAASVVSSTSVALSWTAPADTQTPSSGLSYNLRVGTTPGGSEIVGPMADLLDGSRRLPQRGMIQGTTWTLDHLAPDRTYYWSVQAVDNALAGSAFAGGAAIMAIPVVGDLGPVDFREVTHQRPSEGDRWYRCQTVRPGCLTAEAILGGQIGSAELTLYDADFRPLATSTLVNGHQRIDHQASSAGETYYIRMTGTSSDVDLRLVNLVRNAGTTVIVAGTDGDDHFEFRSGAVRQVSIQGVQYDFAPSQAALVTFDGGAGRNTAVLSGTSETETVGMHPMSATLRGIGFDVSVVKAAEIVANSGGGADVVKLYDSSADDTFLADPTYAQFSGIGFSNRANGFRYVFAYATEGGTDTATLHDSTGNDVFIAEPDRHSATLYGSEFYVKTDSSDSVQATSTGGIDIAKLYDSAGNDTFVGNPATARLSGDGFSNQADNFRYVIGYASSGTDTATLSGSAETDTFVGTPTYASLSGTTYAHRVSSFDVVTANGTPDGADVAKLYDSAGNDALIAYPTDATLSGQGFSNKAKNFRFVHAYATTGGTDAADLYDSSGNDTFVAYPSYGALYATNFYNRANYFDSVVAHSSAGNDLAKLYDSPGDDTFDAYLTYAVLSGPGFSNRVDGFRYVTAYSDVGGSDTANLRGSSGDETITGTYDYTRLQGGTTDITARAFEKVFGLAGVGGQDRANLYDSLGDDHLEAAGEWAKLSYPDRFIHLSELTTLARVKAISSRGGHDTTQTIATDYVLETQGPWTPI